ncbi:MAG: AraC family ligand binding domain-containing protein [Phreatobacter sp.]
MAKRQFTMLRSAMAGVEAVVAETRHRFPRHTHEHFGIGVIECGAQVSASGRGLVEAGAGDTITVNPGEVHDGMPIGEAGRCWRMLYVDPAVIAEAARDISQGRAETGEFSDPVIRSAAIAGRFRELFDRVTAGDDRQNAVGREEALLALLADVMRERIGGDRSSSIPRGVARAQGLIDDDPAAPISLADLARESGLSRFQLLRAFAAATGLTPHAYLVQRRIAVARRLIAAGTPLAEAAFAGGFADQSHMTRVFVRKYGVSPGAYAQALA